MRLLLLFSFVTTLATLAIAACGDDPGASDLPYAYAIDATPDGVLDSDADAGERW